MDFPRGSAVKNPPAMQKMQEMRVPLLGQEDPLEKGTATHYNILTWRIPRTEEPGGLRSLRSQSVGHDMKHARVVFIVTSLLSLLDRVYICGL